MKILCLLEMEEKGMLGNLLIGLFSKWDICNGQYSGVYIWTNLKNNRNKLNKYKYVTIWIQVEGDGTWKN